MTQRTSLPVLLTNRRTSSNTQLSRSTVNNSSSSSIYQVFLDSPCSNHVPLKKLKPEVWQRLFDGKKQQHEIIAEKTTPNLNVTIDEDFINLLNESSLSEQNSRYSFLPEPIQIHIDHLYEQIDDLTRQLSEERLKYTQTRVKTKEIISKHLQNQEKQYEELLQQKLSDHKQELKEQETKYLQSLNEEQTQSLVREEKLRNELNFVKQSFHTYKLDLVKENDEKIQIKVNQALIAMKKQLPVKEEEINTRINEAIMKERKNLNLRQKMEVEIIRKQHRKEIQTIQKHFADTTVDRDHAELLNKELTLTKLALDETKEYAINLSTRLNDLEMQHIETTRELNDYRIGFDAKTKEIEKLNAERVDQLNLKKADHR